MSAGSEAMRKVHQEREWLNVLLGMKHRKFEFIGLSDDGLTANCRLLLANDEMQSLAVIEDFSFGVRFTVPVKQLRVITGGKA